MKEVSYFLIIFFLLHAVSVKAQYKSMIEFSEAFKVPLTRNEMQMLKPKFDISKKEFRSAEFAKDGNFRGNFCKAGALISPAVYKVDGYGKPIDKAISKFIHFNLVHGSENYCQHKDFRYFGRARFDSDMKSPVEIHIGTSKEKILYKGQDIRGWEIFFNDRHHAEVKAVLEKMALGKKDFLLGEDGAGFSDGEYFIVYLLSPIEWKKIEFPAGSRVEVSNGVIDAVALPPGAVVSYGNLKCKFAMDFMFEKLDSCILAEDYEIGRGFVLPKDMIVGFDGDKYIESCGVPAGSSIRRNGKNISLQYFMKSFGLDKVIFQEEGHRLDCQSYEIRLKNRREFKD